jgi:hypothetical protein
MPQEDEARLDGSGDSAEGQDGRGIDPSPSLRCEESTENVTNVLPCLAFPHLRRIMGAVVVELANAVEQGHLRNARSVLKRVRLYISPVRVRLTYGATASKEAPSCVKEKDVASSTSGPIIGALRSSLRQTR